MAPRKPKGLSPATIAIHGGAESRETDAPIVAPIFQSVNYVQEIGSGEGVRYPRYGNAPNAEIIQQRMAALEGTEAALVLSSGMGATACALLALLRPGDHLIASEAIYGGSLRLVTEELPALGIDVSMVDPHELRGWRRKMRKTTRALFLETPVNPTCRVLDLKPASYITREAGIALVVDSTFASPINLRPADHGADVVVHSATKYLNGHHDVIGGVVCGTGSYIEEVRAKMAVWGQAPDPFACWLLERGLKTLDVRIRRHNENGMRLATWCEGHAAIRKVHYPGLPSHPDHAIASRMLRGFGGMLAIELAGGPAAERFLRRLRIFRHAPSLGGVDSLASEPRFTSHAHLTPAQRTAIGIPDGFVRLSVGLEDPDDLIADLDQALRG